jgi:hypothetical protein
MNVILEKSLRQEMNCITAQSIEGYMQISGGIKTIVERMGIDTKQYAEMK